MSKKSLIPVLFVTGILAGSAFAQSLVPIDPATVSDGHVYLMDNLGGNLPDDSPNGNDGNLIGSPQTVAGLNGEALQFDGVGDGVHLPDAAGINLSTHQDHTVIAVFNCDDATKSEKQVVYEEGGTTRGLVIYVHEGQVYVGGWNLSDYTPEWTGTYLSAPIGSGEWHAVSAVLRGGTAAQEDDKFEMWLDGELIAKGPGGEFRSRSNDNGIGYHNSETKYHDGNNSTTGDYFGGLIDEVWILNVALAEAELSVIATNRTGAKRPLPANDGTDVPRDGTLSWGAGIYAQKHNVYLGTGFEDVNNATVTDPLDVLLSEAQEATSIDPGRLTFDQTYYWRVDEVNGAPDFTVFKGEVWNFTIEPFALAVLNITVTASGEFSDSKADNTINGSGMTGDLHGIDAADMWISAGLPATIEYAFDRPYKLHELWIWNSNQLVEAFVGFGAKDVVIEHSLDGENWTVLEGVSQLAQAPGTEGYVHNNTIDFGGIMAQHVRMSISSAQGIAPQASLSEVRFLYIPTFATGPNPASGASDVAPDVTLAWGRNGREADHHDVYVGSTPDGLTLVGSVGESSFDTSAVELQLSQIYYWRVDEVNDLMDPSTWTGDVWSFTTADTLVIDDMESYKDEEFLEIWATWIDGFGDPANNGALVGANPGIGDFSPESTIVHGDRQSLPIHYDNGAAAQSEATRTFAVSQDWTRAGVTHLVVWFHGAAGNTGQMYLKINGTKVPFDGPAGNIALAAWQAWSIDLASLGMNLQSVRSLAVGVEGNGVTGTLYVDDIALEQSVPEPINEWRVSAGTDDAEEKILDGGVMDLTSSDLELGYEGDMAPANLQTVGCRWVGIAVPRGATITEAWVQFSADAVGNANHALPVSLVIQGQLSPNPDAFAATTGAISGRTTTAANVVWDIPEWLTVHAMGPEERTPDISSIIQEIVNQPDWSGEAIVLMFGDNPANPSTGSRESESFDGSASDAPLLHISFE